MKFSKRGQQMFYDHFHYLDGTIEDFEFEQSDIEDGVVISLEEAKIFKGLVNISHWRALRNRYHKEIDMYRDLAHSLKERIKQAENDDE